MERLDSSLFDWLTWRAGSLADLGVATRHHDIVAFRHRVRSHAVGFTDGGCVPCRPKSGTIAVMLSLPDGSVFWTHFYLAEFEAVFGETA